jgi:preprotein translocase subunit SecA
VSPTPEVEPEPATADDGVIRYAVQPPIAPEVTPAPIADEPAVTASAGGSAVAEPVVPAPTLAELIEEPVDEVAAAAAAPAGDPVSEVAPPATHAAHAPEIAAPADALDEPHEHSALGGDVTPPRPPQGVRLPGLPDPLAAPKRPTNLSYTAPSETGDAQRIVSGAAPATDGAPRVKVQEGNTGQRIGSGPARNAPCPCGSGKKYKKCHGAPGATG